MLQMLDPEPRSRIGASRDRDQRVPRVPRQVHLQDPGGQVPSHHAQHNPPADGGPAPEAGEAGPARGGASPRAGRVRALPALVPVVPVRLLRARARVRPVPRRGRGPRAGAG